MEKLMKILRIIRNLTLMVAGSNKFRNKWFDGSDDGSVLPKIRMDLQYHAIINMFAVIGVALFLMFFAPYITASLIAFIAVPFLISLIKELILGVLFKKGVAAWDDVLYNYIGATIGLALLFIGFGIYLIGR